MGVSKQKTQALLARSSPVFLHKSLHSFPHLQALSVKSNQTQSDAKQMIQFQRHIAYMQGFEKCNFMHASPRSSRGVPGNFLFTGVRIFWDSEEQSFSLPLSSHHHMHKTAISRSLFPLPHNFLIMFVTILQITLSTVTVVSRTRYSGLLRPAYFTISMAAPRYELMQKAY